MAWYDFFKIFSYSRRQDPISRKEDEDIQGVGITQPDIPDIRAGSWSDQYSPLNISVDGTDFIDTSTVTNRLNRYKEYDRLQNVAEIENALTTFADEACVAGDTLVATPFGYYTIKDLAASKSPDERFLVYCWDFAKEDFTMGWAFNPRLVKEEETIEIVFHDGKKLRCTKDHLCLKSNFQWVQAQDIKEEDQIICFHRISANENISHEKMNQFPRILSHKQGWMHERQFIDQWKTGKKDIAFKKVNQASKLIHGGLNFSETERVMQDRHRNLKHKLKAKGFSFREFKWLSANFRETRRVIGVYSKGKIPVYDLSVEKHENFATDSVIVHNCQTNEDGYIFKVKVKNDSVKEEVEMLLHNILEMDDRLWGDAKTLYKYGDLFWEIILDINNPKDGIQKVVRLPADSMFRIETIRGKLIEFQQSKTGPDYNSLTKIDPLDATPSDLDQSNCIRFHKDQVIHMRIGDDRKTFYPYGVSTLEAARGPAHQLMLMEDCMMTYRLVRAPERRVFYVDVGTLAPYKAEAYIERIKDQFRKKKTFNKRSPLGGASAVEERYIPPSVEEDFWIPIRPNSQTKIETLAGACLSLDTKIPLLDGRILTLQEIINEFSENKKLWAYSCHPETGEFAPGLITWAGVTRQNTKVMKITLDNGQYVICTPDHKFPIPGKGFIEAKDLNIEDRFFPFNTQEEKLRKDYGNKYKQLYCNQEKQWEFVHRLVANYCKETDLEEKFIYNKASRFNTIHHRDFNRFNNNPENLVWMDYYDHLKYHSRYKELPVELRETRNNNISKSLKEFYINLEDKASHYEYTKENLTKATQVMQDKLKNDPEFKKEFLRLKNEGWVKFTQTEDYVKHCENISARNLVRWQDPEYKENVFKKQRVVLPKDVFNFAVDSLKIGLDATEISEAINNTPELKQSFLNANTHIKRKGVLEDGICAYTLKKSAKQYGYKNWKQLKNEMKLYNHKIVAIEYLEETQDTGTLTIDGDEKYHNYHTFALDCGIYTKNSNLSDTDDAAWFRQKLYIALQFPRNYLSNNDPQANKLTVSQNDTRFARMIERLQNPLAKGLREIAIRHLSLRGWPQEDFFDLQIKITPPSDWRRINRNEVDEVKYNRAATMKGTQLMSDYDILTFIMEIEEDKAKEIVARNKAQKIDDFKLQALAQNPTLLGLNSPEQIGTPMGTSPGGPNPELNPDGMPPDGQPPEGGMPPEGQEGENQQIEPGHTDETQAISKLPEPTEEEIKKYGLEIQDYKQGFDDEEIDDIESGDGI